MQNELKTCIETVRKALVKMGYSYKNKSLHAAEQERSRCAGRTQKMEREYVWIKVALTQTSQGSTLMLQKMRGQLILPP